LYYKSSLLRENESLVCDGVYKGVIRFGGKRNGNECLSAARKLCSLLPICRPFLTRT